MRTKKKVDLKEEKYYKALEVWISGICGKESRRNNIEGMKKS